MTDKLNKNKILLVVANRIDDLYIKFPVSTTSWIKPRFPLGIGSIGATLEESGWNVSILDNYLEKRSAHEVAQMCVDNKFKYVGINANSLTIEEALNIARYIKDLNNKIIVILGGPHPSLFPERVLSYTFVDFVILGEGEIALKNLLKDLESSSCILKKKIVSAERIANLDRLPFPARHLTNFFSYSRKAEVLEETPADVLYTSRGCPYNCAFCSSSLIWKRTYS
ncbi:cobalamin B12-binding domain-containing protein, partial [bacterium]|nr:cobalamin B12-binding domain-containing protein [bacterium]